MTAKLETCNGCGQLREQLSSGRWTCKPCKRLYDQRRREADPEANRARCRDYAARNREDAAARAREWHHNNREHVAAVKREKYAIDGERIREANRKHYQENPEPYRERARKSTWRQDNPDAARAVMQRRRARKSDAVCEHGNRCVTSTFLANLYASDCLYCGQSAEHADHFVPFARGGLHCVDNLVPACGPCNTSKWASDPWEWWERRSSA